MSNIFCTVIICTHNPRFEYMHRVLGSLKSQTLAFDGWELLLIDNASADPVASRFDLSWHPNASHIRENELGLTPARLRGINEAIGALIVFVDDDNILEPDYLLEALYISEKFRFLGVWGGSIAPEFETTPEIWTEQHWGKLAIRMVDVDRWSNISDDWLSTPVGAGLCVRKDVASAYASKTKNWSGPLLGRIGLTGWGGGEDSSIVLSAIEIGYGKGVFSRLKLSHIIPPHRLREDYLINLTKGQSFSGLIVEVVHGLPEKRQDTNFNFFLKFLRIFISDGFRGIRFLIAARQGRKLARKYLNKT